MKPFYFLIITFFISFYANSQLVLPGDYPDPSVTKVGDTYWASATTSNWLPAYPILESKDLINWETKGHVFLEKPDWADYYFWAPEISHENGKVYIYYSAHKKDGNLCLGIAGANNPLGPYTDHGPLICQEAGSIDGFPMRDENGKLYLIWKEDGNSVGKPTPIWAVEINEDRTKLIGEKKELFRNDVPWEGNLVEGVSMIKHNNYYYAFYAGAACCGRGCNYATGIARSKSLLGPWEKYSKNPLLMENGDWKCPGHGTPVEKDGKFYFLYHAYSKESNVYVGRQGLLKEFRFTDDGWIEFVDSPIPTDTLAGKVYEYSFSNSAISNDWQWSVFQKAGFKVAKQQLEVESLPEPSGRFLGHKTYASDYIAQVTVLPQSKTEAGLALIGDEKNLVSVSYDGKNLKVWKLENNVASELTTQPFKVKGKVYLNVEVRRGSDVKFYYSSDGKKYYGLNKTPLNGSFLPPWDRAIRVGVLSKGPVGQKAVFDDFIVVNSKEDN